jgi:hypothetical protein
MGNFTDEISDEMLEGISQETWSIAGASSKTMEARIGEELLVARKRIAELEEKQRWIPVKELPKVNIDQLFLCAIEIECIGLKRVDTRTYFAEAKMFSGDGVTHYMPLPKSPSEV